MALAGQGTHFDKEVYAMHPGPSQSMLQTEPYLVEPPKVERPLNRAERRAAARNKGKNQKPKVNRQGGKRSRRAA